MPFPPPDADRSHAERTALLTSLFDGMGSSKGCIPSLTFAGTVASFDFSGTLFDGCLFEDVTFARCDFDEKTVFRNCRFVGGADASTRGLGLAQFLPAPAGDPEALRWIRNRQAASQKRSYTRDDLDEDFRAVLRKFIGRGGVGLRSVEEASLRPGTVSHSPHADAIIGAARAHVLEPHVISGSGSGLNVRPDAEEAMRFFATNNAFTGPVLAAVEAAGRKISG